MKGLFPVTVSYPKEDVFEICSALALAESALKAAGFTEFATEIGRVFEKAESALSETQVTTS